jgi:curved DNA-binding protein CbpA
VSPNPFAALGLPERPDLDDETVRAAWRAIAAATHPDRADGGNLARYTQASAAYAELRTPWGRSEAYADLDHNGPQTEQARRYGRPGDDDDELDTTPLPAIGGYEPRLPVPPGRLLIAVACLPSRIRRGRPLRLLIRAAVAAGACLAALTLIRGQPAAPADVAGLITWFALTARRDLAPPPER